MPKIWVRQGLIDFLPCGTLIWSSLSLVKRDKDPSLWVKALAYFANKSPIDSYAREMQDVLTSIEREGLLPPLQVLQILSQSESATLGLVKDYIAANLGKEQRHIDEDNRFIRFVPLFLATRYQSGGRTLYNNTWFQPS
jgi:hypothetical protein